MVMLAGVDFSAPSEEVGRQLLGVTLLVDGVGGRIVECEAYDRLEPASHCYIGPTARNAAMFGVPGRIYVYRSYGLHWCMNFVCREDGHGAGVLIRALEPTVGLERMRERRGIVDLRRLCRGPGCVTEALGVDGSFNGHRLDAAPVRLLAATGDAGYVLQTGPRIGVSKAVELPWRFGAQGSRFLSKPFPKSSRAPEPVNSAVSAKSVASAKTAKSVPPTRGAGKI